MNTIKATIRNGRIDVPAPRDLPEGAEVVLTIAESDEDLPLTPDEIARTLAAMERLQPWELPAEIAAELDEWERRINQRGIEHRDPGLEDAFR